MHISEFDYELPKELIAQFPSQKRDESKMLVLNRQNETIKHEQFFNIVEHLGSDDVLVMNNTRVIPARLFGKKNTGAAIEVFLLKDKGDKKWEALIKPSKRIKSNTIITISDELQIEALENLGDGKWLIELQFEGNLYEILDRIGNVPLPPYIERSLTDEQLKSLDYERYQTVYAETPGSVAAPTAGLHFTDEVLEELKKNGVQICYVTLNVGLGTFRPVKVDNILEHNMDFESYEVSKETAQIITDAKSSGKNIIAVGTTTVRTLESVYKKHGNVVESKDSSNLFIYPGYEFGIVDKLLTNFHLPKSTLLMLVSALAGRDFVFKAYQEAINNNYRFYSYGDCMFIE